MAIVIIVKTAKNGSDGHYDHGQSNRAADEIAERARKRTILGEPILNLARQAALLTLREMKTSHHFKLATTSSRDNFTIDRIRRAVSSSAKAKSGSTYLLLLDKHYSNIRFSAVDKFARRGMSYEKNQITNAIKHSERGFLTTKQKRTNLEIMSCSIRTESILAKIDDRTPNPCFICSQVETKAHVFDVLPHVYRYMLHCTGCHLRINDSLIFNNRAKPSEWKSFFLRMSEKLHAPWCLLAAIPSTRCII